MRHVSLQAGLLLVLSFMLSIGRSETLSDIEYGTAGDLSLRMDAEIPPGPGPFPAMLLVHGGGWISGDRRTTLEPLFHPLSRARFAWFSIDYRLATDVTMFGAAIQDVQTAVAFLRSHAADYRIDPGCIVLIGESAGGHLAEMAALTATPATSVRAVVGFYAPTNLLELARTSRAVPENIRRAMKGNWSGIVTAVMRQLSPIEHVSSSMPPFLLIHGTGDTLVSPEQSTSMFQA